MRAAALLVVLCAGVASGNIWPVPTTASYGSGAAEVDPNFAFNLPSGSSPLLVARAAQYEVAITQGASMGDGQFGKCDVVVDDPTDEALTKTTVEAYNITVNKDGSECALGAATIYGAMRAMESLAHMTYPSDGILHGLPLSVDDAPRFNYRGLMLDTSRHFYNVDAVLHAIDGMVASKLNVFHWHMSDTQSFPSDSELYPQLAREGAFAYPEASYSLDDMRNVVAYAKARGVRVMVEFDVPGHGSWGAGMPELMVSDGPCTDTMDPTLDTVYEFLAEFLTEMVGIFDDEYLFLGGDEVQASCYEESPSVSAWMAANDIADSEALQRYFWQQVRDRVFPSLKAAGFDKTLGVWIADLPVPDPADLPDGAFGNVWQSQSSMQPTLDRGKNTSTQVVFSGAWYLDQQKPGLYPGTTDPCSTYRFADTWKCMYAVEPLDGLSEEEASRVLGGETTAWSESINAVNFDSQSAMKMAVVAERLWSASTVTDVDDAEDRLIEHVCRMNLRGIGAQPPNPGYCPSDASASKAGREL